MTSTDLDVSFRAYLAGFRAGVACDIPVIHYSAGNYNPAFMDFAKVFSRKHAANFKELPIKQMIFSGTRVMNKADILSVMSPHYWMD